MLVHKDKDKRQRGALFVEAALVIPFFIYLVVNLIYFSFMLHDYMSLNNLTRNAVRYAAVSASNATTDSGVEDASAAGKRAKLVEYLTNNASAEAMLLYTMDASALKAENRPSSISDAGGYVYTSDNDTNITVVLAAKRQAGEIPLLVDETLPIIITSSLTMRVEVEE